MKTFSPALHAGTPGVAVSAHHGALYIRFLRHPDKVDKPACILISRSVTDIPTRTLRLYGSRPLKNSDNQILADATSVVALSGQDVMRHTVDGDDTYMLPDVAARPLWTRNAQGTENRCIYESPEAGGRLLAITEKDADSAAARVREKYEYGAAGNAAIKSRNLAGAVTRRYDNAGFTNLVSASVTGLSLRTEQHLVSADAPQADWAGSILSETETPLLFSGTIDATGAPLTKTNAVGVTTIMAYDVSGMVQETRLRYRQRDGRTTQEVITLKDILRDADGTVLSQTAGNGVRERWEYEPRTQYLARHLTQRPAGHQAGGLIIADLHYRYDPAGNILSQQDRGADPIWHGNLMATGLREYTYDTLYRLIRASGRERLPVAHRRGTFPAQLADATAGTTWTPYIQTYHYDDGDNLTGMVHAGAVSCWTRITAVSGRSNRSVKAEAGMLATVDPHDAFLPGGLKKALDDGRAISWHADGQLACISPVVRNGQESDSEFYRYVDRGTRVRKVRLAKASGGTLVTVTTYAGGCETRQRILSGTNKSYAQLQVTITETGGIRLIHNELSNETTLRYVFSDHLASVSGETGEDGSIRSREEYYPYGGSAGAEEEEEEWADRTRRYGGKERDATGLIYYGWRYYQPEAGCWLSADPGGVIDGINLYRMVRNNPLNIIDTDGRGSCSSKASARVNDSHDEQMARVADYRAAAALREENRITESNNINKIADALKDYGHYTHNDTSYIFQYTNSAAELQFKRVVINSLENEGGYTAREALAIFTKGEQKGRTMLLEKHKQAIGQEGVAAIAKNRLAKEAADNARKQAAANKAAAQVQSDLQWKALSAAWTFDYQKIQIGSSQLFDSSSLKKKLLNSSFAPDDINGRKTWLRGEGEVINTAIDDLGDYTYRQVQQKLNVAVKERSKTQSNTLYRGVSAREFGNWDQPAGTLFTTGRLTAFSELQAIAEGFKQDEGGMIIVEKGAQAAFIPNRFGESDEREFLTAGDSQFKIINKQGRKIYARYH